MKFIASALVSIFLLSGCSDADWNGAMRSVGMGGDDAPEVASAAMVAAPAPAPDTSANEFCRAVARQQLERQSYDAATQAQVMAHSFQQCMALHEGTY